MTSKTWALSLFGAHRLSAQQRVEYRSQLAGWQDASAFGFPEDFEAMAWPRGTCLSIAEFLNQLESSYEGVVFPFGWREPEVVPVRSVSLIFGPAEANYWTLSDFGACGLDRVSARSAILRSDLIVTNQPGVAEFIKANTGCSESGVWVVGGIPASFADFVEALRPRLSAPAAGTESAKPPKFSLITPSYNQAQYIERTIQSVLGQEYPDFEYIVVDGASTDWTLDILKRYEGRLKWISEPDRGYADAVNKGGAQASGDYVMWIPSDDLLNDSQVLNRLAATIQKTGADVVYGDAFYIDAHDRLLSSYRVYDYGPETLVDWCLICQPSTAFRRDLFEKVGRLNSNLRSVADYDLWMRFSAAGASFERTGYAISRYRIHPNSITTRQRFLTFMEIFERQWSYYGCVGASWVKAAVHEVRLTVFGLFRRPGDVTASGVHRRPHWGARLKFFLKKILMWEKVLRVRAFQRVVFCLTKLSYRMSRMRSRLSPLVKPSTDVHGS